MVRLEPVSSHAAVRHVTIRPLQHSDVQNFTLAVTMNSHCVSFGCEYIESTGFSENVIEKEKHISILMFFLQYDFLF